MFTVAVLAVIVIPCVAGGMTMIASRTHDQRVTDWFRWYRTVFEYEPRYRPPSEDESMSEELARFAGQLEQLGFQRLGVLVEEWQAVPTCYFTDEKRTTVVTFIQPTIGVLLSYDRERAVLTRMTKWPQLARVPTTTGDDVPPSTSLAEMLALHRKRIADMDGLTAIATLDDAVAAFKEVRARTRAWRLAQPPPELLEADLQLFFGTQHKRFGPIVTKRLHRDLPVAKARFIDRPMSLE